MRPVCNEGTFFKGCTVYTVHSTVGWDEGKLNVWKKGTRSKKKKGECSTVTHLLLEHEYKCTESDFH